MARSCTWDQKGNNKFEWHLQMKCPNIPIKNFWQQENIHYSQMHTEHSGKITWEVTQHILTHWDYTECLFWPYGMKLEINQRRKPGKLTNM